jgi:hypothetical protein
MVLAPIAREDAGDGGTDLLRSHEAPVSDALLKLLEPGAHSSMALAR